MAKQQLSKRSLKTGHMGGLLASVSVLALMMASGPAKADLVSLCGMNVFNDTNVVNVEETLTGTCEITLMDGATLRIHSSSISGDDLRILDANGGGSVDITSSEFNVNIFFINVDNEAKINNTQIVSDTGLGIFADDISVANADFDDRESLRITGDRVRVVNSELTGRSEIRITGNDDLQVINNEMDESTNSVRIMGSPTGQASIIGNTIHAGSQVNISTGVSRVAGNHIEAGGTSLRIDIVSGRVQNNMLTIDADDILVSAVDDLSVQGNEFNNPLDGVMISGDPCTIKNNTDNTSDGIDTGVCI